MALMTFNPPGFVDDLDPAGRQAWHDKISKFMDAARRGRPQIPHSAPRPQFFNPAKTPIGVDAATEDVKWTAFPRIVTLESGSDAQRWKKADSSRDTQDEYCEWSIKRNAANKVVSIAFTCEGPEYWDTLAASRPDKVLELYRQHVDPAVQRADLFDPGGNYIPNNRWNNSVTDGVMHLIQENNTLGAEIEIAGAATIVRLTPAGAIMTDTRELIECGRYGQVERNSDPFIGARVNFHARAKADVTIADPIGIHFAGLDTQGWITPPTAPTRARSGATRAEPTSAPCAPCSRCRPAKPMFSRT
jgi:hypothetical protein